MGAGEGRVVRGEDTGELHPRYAEWIAHVFDHPATEEHWSDAWEGEWFEGDDATIVTLITQTFLRSGEDLKEFSDTQVGRGIDYVINPSHSDYMFAVRDGDVPLERKIAAIESIEAMYRDCLAVRCGEVWSDDWTSFFMFWDVIPINYLEGHPQREPLMEAIMGVLERTLALENEACQYAALHGLGHVAFDEGERVEGVIDRWMAGREMEGALREYAERARAGMVE